MSAFSVRKRLFDGKIELWEEFYPYQRRGASEVSTREAWLKGSKPWTETLFVLIGVYDPADPALPVAIDRLRASKACAPRMAGLSPSPLETEACTAHFKECSGEGTEPVGLRFPFSASTDMEEV